MHKANGNTSSLHTILICSWKHAEMIYVPKLFITAFKWPWTLFFTLHAFCFYLNPTHKYCHLMLSRWIYGLGLAKYCDFYHEICCQFFPTDHLKFIPGYSRHDVLAILICLKNIIANQAPQLRTVVRMHCNEYISEFNHLSICIFVLLDYCLENVRSLFC